MLNILEKVKKRSGATDNKVEHFDVTCYAEMVTEYLRQLEIEYVFGVPGGPLEPFLNALAKSERCGGPKLIVSRHECNAVFMADGYHRETGKMGAVCCTTGPGATNVLTGVASALLDEIPILVISAQTSLPKFGKRAAQESSCTGIDITGMMKLTTKYSTLISHKEQLESKLVAGLLKANQAPAGPVHISIPTDILRAPCKFSKTIAKNLLSTPFQVTDKSSIEALIEKLKKADCLAVYIGFGAGSASKQIMDFIEVTGTPFISSPMGKAWVDETHPLYRGVFGFAGHESARKLLKETKLDYIIAVGALLGEAETSGWQETLLNEKLIHIDSSVDHFSDSHMADSHILGSISSSFSKILQGVKTAKSQGKRWHTLPGGTELNVIGNYVSLDEPKKCLSDSTPLKPQRLMRYLSLNLPPQTRVFVDIGNVMAWAIHYFISSDNTGMFRFAMGYGSMTWSIGASIGSSLANPHTPTVCIVGDGSYLMSAQEITVAAKQNLPIVFIILNDSALGMVYHGQKLGKQESIGWELNKIDFAAMSEAAGVRGITIDTPHDLESLDFELLFNSDGPTVIDARIELEEIPPMSERIDTLRE